MGAAYGAPAAYPGHGIAHLHNLNIEDDFLKGSEKAIRMDFDLATKKWKRRGVLLRIKREPFASGSMRAAHIMYDLTLEESDKQQFVAKISRDPKENRQVYFDDVEMQMEAKAWAEQFNKKFQKNVVDFLVAYVVELVERPGRPVIGVENWVPGNYVKYNNNWDWNDDKRNTPQAFSHFTWEASQHKLLICDLQGVGDLWTDPQVHSADGQGYGKGNMGMRGIQAFLNNHRCNRICHSLGLPQVGKAPKHGCEGTALPLALAIEQAQTKAQDFALNFQVEQTRKRPPARQPAASGPLSDRVIIQVLDASFNLEEGDEPPDTMVVITVGTHTNETRVAYGTRTPVWENARFQMVIPRDGTDNVTALVFKCTNSSEAGEQEIIGAVAIPFTALRDDAGYDDRNWPLRPFAQVRTGDATGPDVGMLHLKIIRFNQQGGANIPRPNKAPPVPPSSGPGAEISKIKIMVKNVYGLGAGSHQATAVVMVDGNQAQTKPGTGDHGVVRWDQKMAFPTCNSNSYIELKVFSRDAAANRGVEWSGRLAVVELEMDRNGNVGECKVPINNTTGGGRDAGVIIQAWVTFAAPVARSPAPQQGTVSC